MTPTLEEIIATLRARGERITIPRRWALSVLLEVKGHLTSEQIHRRMVERGIQVDEATVYRCLQWLKENEIVAQTDIGQGADVYCLLAEQRHHHLVCLHCGQIIDANDELFTSLKEQLLANYRFEPRIDHYAIFGLCHYCQERQLNQDAQNEHD